jgi:hypothetical protein
MGSDLAVALENLVHRGRLACRGAAQLGRQRWYWRLGYALWLESLRGPAYRLGHLPAPLGREDLIYGETPLGTAYQLLNWGQLQLGQRFCEIGCGRGVTSLVARLVFGAQVTSYEAVERRADKARWLSRALDAGLEVVTQSGGPYVEADLYYLTPTTWSEANWNTVQQALEVAPSGSRALVLTQPLKDWNLLEKRLLPYSWGWSQTYLLLKP